MNDVAWVVIVVLSSQGLGALWGYAWGWIRGFDEGLAIGRTQADQPERP